MSPIFERYLPKERQYGMESATGTSAPVEQRPITETENQPEFPEIARARKILNANFGNYTAIIENLKSEGILPESIDWVQKDLEMKMPEASFLEASDYEMMFVLRLFHPETYEHSIRTYLTGKEKILSNHPVGEYLRRKITEEIPEGNALEVVYRSLLLHDMGKIAVPVFILDDTHTDANWASLGEEHCLQHSEGKQGICYEAKLEEAKETNPSARYKDVVPIKYGYKLEPEKIEIINKFGGNLPKGYEEYAYTSDAPLGKIVEIHPAISAAVLESAGKHIEAQIVREHHASEASPEQKKYPTASGALFFSKSLASVVHAADFMDALLSPRSYKGALGLFLTLSKLSEEAVNKTLPKELADLWIDADIDQFRNEMDTVFEQAQLTTEERARIGGSLNYYISKLPPKQQEGERKFMKDILDQFRPRHTKDGGEPSNDRRKI